MPALVFFPLECAEFAFKEGKTPEDYDAIVARYIKLMDKIGIENHVAFTTEAYYHDEHMAYHWAWWSYWPSGRHMGEYSTAWAASWEDPEGGEIASEYTNIVDYGNHKCWSTAVVSESTASDNLNSESMLVIQHCRINEGVSRTQALEAVQALAAHWVEHGADSTVWIQFPSFASHSDDFDFRLVSIFNSFQSLCDSWELFAPGSEVWEQGEDRVRHAFVAKTDTANFVTVRRNS